MPRPLPPLHLVTDDAVLEDADFLKVARQALAAGEGEVALHLRGPRLSGRRLYELADALTDAARTAGALLLINDRLDVALACGADGAQLGARGIPAAAARRLLGPDLWLGASVHARGEAEEAAAGGADFLLVGTLFETASHPGRAGAGGAILARLAGLGPPRIGIGGITPERIGEVRRAGAAGVAVLRGVWQAPDPAAAVRVYLREWKEAT